MPSSSFSTISKVASSPVEVTTPHEKADSDRNTIERVRDANDVCANSTEGATRPQFRKTHHRNIKEKDRFRATLPQVASGAALDCMSFSIEISSQSVIVRESRSLCKNAFDEQRHLANLGDVGSPTESSENGYNGSSCHDFMDEVGFFI